MQYLFNYVYDRLINEAKKQEKIKNPLKYRGTGPQGFRSDVSVNKIEGKPPVKGTGDSDIGGAVISGWKRRVMLLMTLILTDKETAPKFNKLMERSGELIRLASGTSKILSKYQDELSRIESLIDVKKEEGKKVLKEKGLILGELKHPSLYNIINFIELYKDELLTDKSLSNRFKKMLDNNTSFTDEDKMAAMDAFNEYVQEGEGFDYMMDQIKDIGQKERYTGARDSILTPERKKELQKKLTGGKEIVKGFKQETATKRGYKKERGFVYDTSQEGGVRELPLKKQEIERVNKGINNIISQLKIDIDKLEVKRQKIYNLSVRGDELAPKRLEKVAKEFPKIIDVFKFLSTKAGENLNETFDTIEFGGKAYTLEDLDGTNIP